MLNVLDSLRQSFGFLAGVVQNLNKKHDSCSKSAPFYVPSNTIIEVPEHWQSVSVTSIKVDGFIKTAGFMVIL